MQLNLVRDELPEAAFDFVHTRMVLIEEDTFPIALEPPGSYAETWAAFISTMRAAGVDPEWARRLPGRLASLGLADVEGVVDVQLFCGGSRAARFWGLTWLQSRERLVGAGVDGALVDRGRDAPNDPAHWFYGPAMVIASGRRR
jgi:hypothetical protein